MLNVLGKRFSIVTRRFSNQFLHGSNTAAAMHLPTPCAIHTSEKMANSPPPIASKTHGIKESAECDVDNSNVVLNQHTGGFGDPRLVNVLTKMYSKLINREIHPLSEMQVTASASDARSVTILGLVYSGDEVIIIEPFFDCYTAQVKLAGATPVFIPLRPMKESGVITSADWALDPEELASKFNTKTKAIIVSTPNNPLGKVFKREELEMIADLCKKHNTFAIMDEVQEWMIYEGAEHIRMATLPGMWERTITIGSSGKTVTGWNAGWAYGPANLLVRPQVIYHQAVNVRTKPVQEEPGVIGYEIRTKPVQEEPEVIGFEIKIGGFGTPAECHFLPLPAELDEKRKKIAKMLSDAGINHIIPEGGYFIMADVRDIMKKVKVGGDPNERSDYRFVKWLSLNRKFQGNPPSLFYEENKHILENYIQFCLIKEDENPENDASILIHLKKDIEEGKL